MGNREFLKGIVYVALGAASYGMLATFVRMAYSEGFTTAEVTVSQFVYGLLGLFLVMLLTRKADAVLPSRKEVVRLMIAGTSMGFTSLFYYISVRYIPVSIAIVLLMQTVWMGVVAEAVLERRFPPAGRIIAVLVVLLGTMLAVNAFGATGSLDLRGLFWGLLAAASFTATMFTANRIALGVRAEVRSLFMLCGGAVIVFSAAAVTTESAFDMGIFLKWGILLALFGTVIPPILLNKGFPLAGIGPGSIVSSLELPVSVTMAWIFLGEEVRAVQWLGIALIIAAIVMMNLRFLKSVSS